MKAAMFLRFALFSKWHDKFDFDFQKNILQKAISFIATPTLGIYELPKDLFQEYVGKWIAELESKFPKHPSCYYLKAKFLIQETANRGEIMSTLLKGLNLDPTNEECLTLMKKHRVSFRFKDTVHVDCE